MQSFDLSYRRLPLTDGSPLLVTPDTRPRTVTVSGFATAVLAVYDVTNSLAPADAVGASPSLPSTSAGGS